MSKKQHPKPSPRMMRKRVLDMVVKAQSGHIGGSFSCAEIVACLYSDTRVANIFEMDRDVLILSKGHAVPIVYAALVELGLIKEVELLTFRQVSSRLQGHPYHRVLPYLYATTGSLGQGLSIACGHALAMKMRKMPGRVFCIVGDGELQEGQNWEALMFAAHHKLDNLVCIVDRNGGQNDGLVEETMSLGAAYCGCLRDKFRAFGWRTWKINGNDIHAFRAHLGFCSFGMPTCIIADTVKGAGVSFMHGIEWHGKVPNKEEYAAALKELGFDEVDP